MNTTDKQYNWWTDPANAEVVAKLSWWDHPENQTTVNIPIAISPFDDSTETYIVTTGVKDEEKYLGKDLHGTGIGKTKELAIADMFANIRIVNTFWMSQALRFERWVPLIVGPGGIAGSWIAIFGLHFYFRYGKNMKHGWYVPFTKLNIIFVNKWKTYKQWKNAQNSK